MALSFVGAGTPGGHSPSNPTLPAGLATNDILIMQTVGGETDKSGWTRFVGTAATNASLFWQRYAGAGAPTGFTDSVVIYAYRGAILTGSPIGGIGGGVTGGTTFSLTVAGVTTQGVNSWALFFGVGYNGARALNFVAPFDGPAQVLDFNTLNAIQPDGLHTAFLAAHGDVGTPGLTAEETLSVGVVTAGSAIFPILIELLPAPPPPITSHGWMIIGPP